MSGDMRPVTYHAIFKNVDLRGMPRGMRSVNYHVFGENAKKRGMPSRGYFADLPRFLEKSQFAWYV